MTAFTRTTLGLEGLETSSAHDVDRQLTQPQVAPGRWAGFSEHAPNRQPRGKRLGPCRHCRSGDHQLCTGVGCFGCTGEHRGYGVAAGSNGLQGGSAPEGGFRR